ncbi:MAG: methyltransferase domain-containing protein [Acidobacteria bacterium]|nr:methyltransferase domain-containing protein [Acidobacteriota bacterium]MDA1236605.1 methyltransferase domain-containing protein [Acidobacteriota bacterium]
MPITSHTQAVRDAYDELAATYDEDFTESVIGRLQRDALWRRFGGLFERGQKLLDLGCGTGEDALHFAQRGISVHGVDVSPAMIEIAERRTEKEERISLETLSLEGLARAAGGPYDGAFSSFGPINCVGDLPALARDLGALIRPGGTAALCLMKRHCLWETLLYPLTAALHRKEAAAEAWSDRPAEDGDFRAFYQRVREVRRAFAPWFEYVAAPGVGVFVPPSYLEPYAVRHVQITAALSRADRATAHWPGFRTLAENRLVILRRR